MARFLEVVFVAVISYVAYSYFSGKVDTSSIRGKRVLVTGASQNIGEEIAYQYAKLGARIVITARREKTLQKVAAKCLDLGAAQAEYISADMSDGSVYQSVVDDAAKKLGGLDIVVLNHVFAKYGLWKGTSEEMDVLRKSTVVNYWSYVGIASAAMPTLKRSEGQLIVVASQAGRPALPNVAAYGATKAAIINFFSSLQMEQMKERQQFPSITIGYLGAIDTDQARWATQQDNINIKGYPLADTASEIIVGGLRRDRYIYLPWYIRFMSLIREINPTLFDKAILRFVYKV